MYSIFGDGGPPELTLFNNISRKDEREIFFRNGESYGFNKS
tara:strand:- start:385 stop:507 length:123 start_codon:yes stop_codon:yes gene_type:complete